LGHLYIMLNYNMTDQSSDLMKIELLDKEFTLLLDQYQQVSRTLFSVSNSQTNKYDIEQGREIVGGNVISYETTPTIDSCQALCSSNSMCSGANYDSKTDTCIITSGNIDLDATNNKDNYGIVTQKKNLLIQLQSINENLSNVLNRSILLVKNMHPNSQIQTRQVSVETEKLILKNNLLQQNKIETQRLIDENNNLNNILNTSTIMVDQSNLSYFFWTIGVIIMIILAIKLFSME